VGRVSEMSRRDFLTGPELGMAYHRFEKIVSGDPFWDRADYKRAVLFWCSDLRIVRNEYRFVTGHVIYEIRTPGDRRVAFGESQEAAWKLAAAVILDHLTKTTKERANG